MDSSYMRHDAPRPEPRQPQPGELLFELRRGIKRFRCELRTHGEWGVEAQFLLDGSLLIGRRFDNRVQAVAWATQEQKVRLAGGWTLAPGSAPTLPGLNA
jgi:hypothetical protein